MSCLLDQIAAIGNTTDVVQWLCPHLTPSGSQGSPSIGSTSSQLTASEWNEEWEDWGDMDPGGGTKPEGGDNSTATHSSSSPQPETSWLAECYIAASPTSDLMAVGFKNRLAILSRRWESYAEEENKMRLVVTWRGTVGYGASDEINAILCLPLLSQKQSSTGGPDWTCVIVGFTSGYVAMYTECGLVLLSQIFEEGPVLSLKCRTMTDGSRAVLSQDTSEELIILYPRSITTIDGFSLFQTLRGCRNQVAKAAASGGENVSVPPLGYKKWGLVDQGMVMDCAGPGVTPPHLYDHLAQTSLAKGFNHVVSSGVPASSLLLTVGRVPFVGFLYAQEGSAPPFVADVALLYASKLKDALVSAASGWLFGRGKNREAEKSKEKPKIEPATPLPYKWSVPDKRRTGLSLSLAPGRRLAAVTDDFGRVTLIDVQRGVALRMWKGYRDADCGWLEVEGEWGGMKRQVAFLLIYAPRRGLLEVWTPQQGPRVAAFNVPKHSRLLYTPHTLLGVNSVRGVRCKVFPVLFVTPDGQISEVIVPFHMALGGKTSKRARDLHLLKTLKSHLRNNNEEEVLKTVSEIKTSGVRKQAVQALILSQHLTSSLLQGLLDIFLPVYCPGTEEDKEDCAQSQDHESRLLGQQLLRLKQLLQLYMVLVELHTSREASPDPDDETLVLELARLLVLTPAETKSFLSTFEHYANSKTTNSKKVRFSDSSVNFSIGSFIRCWDVTVGSLVKNLANKTLPVNMKEDIQQEKLLRLGEFLYGWAWHSESMKKFSQAIEESGSNLESLLHVALHHWSLCCSPDTVPALHLGTIFYCLSTLAGEKVLCDISQLSPWWSSVRDKLVASTQPYQAYIAALLCRGVHANLEARLHSSVTENALHFKKDIIQTSAVDDTDQKCLSLNDWEGLSMEMVEWNLVIDQLECLLPLNQFLSLVPENGPQRQPKLEVSVKDLLDKGKGYVAELVANWFIGSGMDHQSVVQLVRKQDELRGLGKEESEKMEDDSEQIDQMEVTSDAVPNDLKQVDGKIAELLMNVSKKFPNSVAADSVLTNMSWELSAAWNKTRDDTSLISQAVKLVGSIRNSHIRHGVSLMLWETWVCQFVQLTTSLMDKVGRIPKDRLCRRDLGLGDHNLAPVLQAVLTLLEQIMEANVVCEVEKPLVIPADSFWSGQEGSPALVELTVMQKMTCYDLVYQHYQLVSVLYLVTQHGLKSVRPLTYFDGKDRSVLFKPLTTSWTIGGHTDPTVIKARLALLCRVITAAVSSLPDTTEFKQGDSLSIRQAIDLGRAWGTSLDVLHRHHICELYTSGLDKLAEEELPTISDATLLGSQLVLITGQRLNYQLENSPRTAHHLALTSPTITEWIKSCDAGSLRCPAAPLESTVTLLTHALSLLPEDAQEHKMATALYDTLTAFVKDQSNADK
ncbi:rab3 GTPase-activating protein non-catalytic subunit-like [Penaeus chinensis]|uniref:rab3 GTPase-activating protein non-catalytic subunit-like n=1 Tax=Penaeus chinensis TaxID=139456 RepID=UPI001FB686B6|nr:rab3 GTPase-activating protein non-catalytic subunit-like [Penaeus chinensis]XP_047492249.1 rab3 GTPase-activating protein non-catalytic subunit-like [Penaeus chinensis]